MEQTYNYPRIIDKNRNATRLIDLGRAGMFHEIKLTNCNPPEKESVGDILFTSIHLILSPQKQKKFTAFRSEAEPEILLIVWRDFPYYREIEEGGGCHAAGTA
ncbi:MAG TPA: hypothetical protein PK926_07995 [Spirochaetota bacterium]|nr:hypothetical protein [Spirochaetota bacterium]HPI88550.1 hypothetical protein [Spirochaetota bacterium]HPR48030.1 hypothetical protein [Spirochaetota bacterium]